MKNDLNCAKAAAYSGEAELPTKGQLVIFYERRSDSFEIKALGESARGPNLSVALEDLIRKLYKRRGAFAALDESEISDSGKATNFAIRALLGDAEPKGPTR